MTTDFTGVFHAGARSGIQPAGCGVGGRRRFIHQPCRRLRAGRQGILNSTKRLRLSRPKGRFEMSKENWAFDRLCKYLGRSEIVRRKDHSVLSRLSLCNRVSHTNSSSNQQGSISAVGEMKNSLHLAIVREFRYPTVLPKLRSAISDELLLCELRNIGLDSLSKGLLRQHHITVS